ncbi:hypothetical protein [Sporisorium scitamineum]|nr:hypothetical protein [Sporisorium scitamineum]
MDAGGGGTVPAGAEHLYSEMEGDARGHAGEADGWDTQPRAVKRERSYADDEDRELYGKSEKNPRFREDDDDDQDADV